MEMVLKSAVFRKIILEYYFLYESWLRETFHAATCFQASLKANPNVMVRMNPQNIVLQAADNQQDTEETTPTMHLQEGLTEQDAVTESTLILKCY